MNRKGGLDGEKKGERGRQEGKGGENCGWSKNGGKVRVMGR